MPANTKTDPRHCPYCHQDYETWTLAEHVYHPDHLKAVVKYKRSAAYRNRQLSLPFPSTLHDPPKLK